MASRLIDTLGRPYGGLSDFQAPITAALGSAICLWFLAASTPAYACGGFMCSNTIPDPPKQTDERILFIDHDDDRVTAVVQVSYEGDADRFAWVVPVPGIPEVGVSSNIVFDRIARVTDPQFIMTTERDQFCGTGMAFSAGISEATGGGITNDGANNQPSQDPVQVIMRDSVGPYDYEIISVEEGHPDPTGVAVEWLRANGYDVAPLAADLIDPYLSDGSCNLIAFRLTGGSDVGDIRPIQMTYETENPTIPIKLTALATTANMGVQVWVFSEARAVPMNYMSLEPNLALIDWFNGGNNYRSVIDIAADEAGGHGFATEFAGSSQRLADIVWTPQDEAAWERIRTTNWSGREADLIIEVTDNYGTWDAFVDVAVTFISPVTNGSFTDLVENPRSLFSPGDGVSGFDSQGFVNAITDVVGPVADAYGLLIDQPYVTRLFTTMSAGEMNIDPFFDYNHDLPDVTNRRTAHQTISCALSGNETGWEIEFDDGTVVRGEGDVWPFTLDDMPANRTITDLDTVGDGEIIADNNSEIDATISQFNSQSGSRGMFACSVNPAAERGVSGAGLLFTLGLGLAILRRLRQ